MTHKWQLPPENRTITPPAGGWKPQTYYTVWIAFNKQNPIHKSIFFSGFLNKGEPGTYSIFFNPCYSSNYDLEDAHFLEIISEIPDMYDGPEDIQTSTDPV